MACIANMSGAPRQNYRVGLPCPGTWREVLNTDAEIYGGSGGGNFGAVIAADEAWHGQPASATMYLPALSVMWFVPDAR